MKRTTCLLEITQTFSEPFSTVLICENRFNLFDFIDISQNGLLCRISNAMFTYRTSFSLFCKKFYKVIVFRCYESPKDRAANGTKPSGLNLFSQINGTVEQGLRHALFCYFKLFSIKSISSSIARSSSFFHSLAVGSGS